MKFKKFKKFKHIGILLFVFLAGILYSCKSYKDRDVISLDHEGDISSDNDDLSTDEDISKNKDHIIHQSLQEEESLYIDDLMIYVHICGAVKMPDVYSVSEHTRLYELVKIAGGFTDDAAVDYINQATTLVDGEQVYIPTKEEVDDLELPIVSKTNEHNDKAKININKASKEELMTLTGIGESKANSIIDYRQKNGGFNRIEDIMKINGIKNSVFDKISEFITVD